MRLKKLFEVGESKNATTTIAADDKKAVQMKKLIINQLRAIKTKLAAKIKDNNEANDDDIAKSSGANNNSVSKIMDGTWASDKDQVAFIANFLARNGLTVTVDGSSLYDKVENHLAK